MGSKRLARVVIVGRANVGKSTLFNRLVEKDKALVSDIAGTTRDRNVDIVYWQGFEFELTDTGGLDIDLKTANEIEKGIVTQAETAVKDADLVLFLADARDGIMPDDREIARKLLKAGVKDKCLLVANKAETMKWRQGGDWSKLGFGEPQFISAANGSGTGDLLDVIASRFGKAKFSPASREGADESIKLAIVGRPNVGKSSLLNAILGEERVIVTDQPHTTRESHDSGFRYGGRDFTIIDTAGIVKRGKIAPRSLERKSIDKSIDAIGQADVVVLVTEVQKKIDAQDKKITQEILEQGKSVIIAANKWDLIPDKETNTVNKFIQYYQTQFPYLWWAPVIFISAKEGQRARKVLDLALEIVASRAATISQSRLDKFLKSKIKQHRPSRGKGLKNPYIYKLEQVGTNPPRFYIHVNDPTVLHFSYIRFLQNHLRETFKIIGTPIQTELKKWKGGENENAKPAKGGKGKAGSKPKKK